MLSYVEHASDAEEVRSLLPDADLALKIESQRGLGYVRNEGTSQGRLMAARGDLYIEVPHPHNIVGALREIVVADPDAIVASRLFGSLSHETVPAASDIGDAAFLMSIGYRTFMLGDDVCFQRDSVLAALNLLESIAEEMA
jgi:pyruvate kinase